MAIASMNPATGETLKEFRASTIADENGVDLRERSFRATGAHRLRSALKAHGPRLICSKRKKNQLARIDHARDGKITRGVD